jgi:hypothetical protein
MGTDLNLQLPIGAASAADGIHSVGRAGRTTEQVISQVHGQYYEASSRGKIFMAQAIITAPVIWTTEAGTGGPLLWNSSASVIGNILAVGWGISTVSTAGAAVGLTGGYAQTADPTSTTAIDSQACLNGTSTTPTISAYRVGTTGTNRWFLPLGDLYTGALTVDVGKVNWVRLDGLLSIPQYSFVSFSASATASTTVMNVAIIWEEVPV